MVALAFAVERVVLRPLVNQPPITLFMATIGLAFLIEGIAQGVLGAQVHSLDIGVPDVPFSVGGVNISQFDLFAAAIAAVLVTALAVFFKRTRVGRALRAVADDHQAALAVGIPLRQIWVIVWSVAGFVALVAGILWGCRIGVQFSLTLVTLKALPVLILGGFTSIPGADRGRPDRRREREARRGLPGAAHRKRNRELVPLRAVGLLPPGASGGALRRAPHRESLMTGARS